MTNEQALNAYFGRVIKDLRSDQAAKNIRASGESAASLKSTATDSGGQLVGSSYFYQQIMGRKPGKFAPPDAILKWIQEKGITPKDPKTSLKSLAYLINRKLATKGTDIFLNKRPGLSFDDITQGSNMEQLLADVMQNKVKEVISFLKTEIEKA